MSDDAGFVCRFEARNAFHYMVNTVRACSPELPYVGERGHAIDKNDGVTVDLFDERVKIAG
jgi:hypothetical protein